MSRHMWFGIGGVIIGLILFGFLPWWVPVLVIAASIAIPVVAWAALGSSNRRRIIQMRRRGQLGP
jgi:membrane protein implicated in regulation of membrane protease activity